MISIKFSGHEFQIFRLFFSTQIIVHVRVTIDLLQLGFKSTQIFQVFRAMFGKMLCLSKPKSVTQVCERVQLLLGYDLSLLVWFIEGLATYERM